ncbi:hypothetical protein TNCV_2425811 [Trichonephila clavipes]|nr:hypothetical protein TNCV_2425811 [Trichonephila clavipes]
MQIQRTRSKRWCQCQSRLTIQEFHYTTWTGRRIQANSFQSRAALQTISDNQKKKGAGLKEFHQCARENQQASTQPPVSTLDTRRPRGESPREKKFGGVTGMNGLRAVSPHRSSTPRSIENNNYLHPSNSQATRPHNRKSTQVQTCRIHNTVAITTPQIIGSLHNY